MWAKYCILKCIFLKYLTIQMPILTRKGDRCYTNSSTAISNCEFHLWWFVLQGKILYICCCGSLSLSLSEHGQISNSVSCKIPPFLFKSWPLTILGKPCHTILQATKWTDSYWQGYSTLSNIQYRAGLNLGYFWPFSYSSTDSLTSFYGMFFGIIR
jgi:hypothetical protein